MSLFQSFNFYHLLEIKFQSPTSNILSFFDESNLDLIRLKYFTNEEILKEEESEGYKNKLEKRTSRYVLNNIEEKFWILMIILILGGVIKIFFYALKKFLNWGKDTNQIEEIKENEKKVKKKKGGRKTRNTKKKVDLARRNNNELKSDESTQQNILNQDQANLKKEKISKKVPLKKKMLDSIIAHFSFVWLLGLLEDCMLDFLLPAWLNLFKFKNLSGIFISFVIVIGYGLIILLEFIIFSSKNFEEEKSKFVKDKRKLAKYARGFFFDTKLSHESCFSWV